jgi:hypothetical protein
VLAEGDEVKRLEAWGVGGVNMRISPLLKMKGVKWQEIQAVSMR